MATAWLPTVVSLAARVRYQQALFRLLQPCHRLLPLELTRRLLRVRLVSLSYRLHHLQLALLQRVLSQKTELAVLRTIALSVVTGLKVAAARELYSILLHL